MHQYQHQACILVHDINLKEEENEKQITEKVKHALTHNLGFGEEEVQQELDNCWTIKRWSANYHSIPQVTKTSSNKSRKKTITRTHTKL